MNELRRWMNVLCEGAEPLHVIAFHGTPNTFTAFDPDFIGSMHDSGYFGRGFYFSTSYTAARGYGGENGAVLRCRLTLHNPLKLHSFSQFDYRNLIRYTGDIAAGLKRDGHDSVICAHYPRHADDDHSTEIMVIEPNQIEVLDVLRSPQDEPTGSGDELRDMMRQDHHGRQKQVADFLAKWGKS